MKSWPLLVGWFALTILTGLTWSASSFSEARPYFACSVVLSALWHSVHYGKE